MISARRFSKQEWMVLAYKEGKTRSMLKSIPLADSVDAALEALARKVVDPAFRRDWAGWSFVPVPLHAAIVIRPDGQSTFNRGQEELS